MKAVIFDRKQSNWDTQDFQFVCFIFILFFNWSRCLSPNHPHVLSPFWAESALLVQLLRAEKKPWKLEMKKILVIAS